MSYPITFQDAGSSMVAAGDFDLFPSLTDPTPTPTPRYSYNQGETIYLDYNLTQSGFNFGITPSMYGPWDFHVYLERIGPDSPTDPLPTIPPLPYVVGNPHTYNPTRFAIPTAGVNPGTFKVTVTACLMASGTHIPFAGFGEGPLIQIHSV